MLAMAVEEDDVDGHAVAVHAAIAGATDVIGVFQIGWSFVADPFEGD